jgi:hypothetical protein
MDHYLYRKDKSKACVSDGAITTHSVGRGSCENQAPGSTWATGLQADILYARALPGGTLKTGVWECACHKLRTWVNSHYKEGHPLANQ